MSRPTGMSNGSSALSPLDRAMRDAMGRPLSPEELSGFGLEKRKPPRASLVVKRLSPHQPDGPKGHGWFIGVKGTF